MNYENYLFERYKDEVLIRKEFLSLIKKNFQGVDEVKLYNKIIDYQIHKYHCQLRYMGFDNSIQFKRNWKNRQGRRKRMGIRKRGIDD